MSAALLRVAAACTVALAVAGPNPNCNASSCYFRYICEANTYPFDKANTHCGQVDAAPAMPPALFDPADADMLALYIAFTADGLVPAIAQQHDTGEVLMVAWMNKDAVAETLNTGQVCYWSRSRHSLWRKGESSGQVQNLVELRLDCDGDTLLLLVDQTGVACHTGRRNCFFRAVRNGELVTIADVEVDPDELYHK